MAGDRRAEHLSHNACGLLRLALLACRYADKAAGLEAESLGEGSLLILKELCNAAGKLAVFVDLEPVGLHACLDLNIGADLVDLLARQVAAGDNDRLDGVALGKGSKIGAGHERGDILNNEVNAQVGLIRAVLFHRLVVADAAEGRLVGYVVCSELFKNRGQDILNDRKNILLTGKGHLHIELIELAG